MEKKDDGGPAFPTTELEWNEHHQRYLPTYTVPGMPMRDYFAGQALAVHDLHDLVDAEYCGANPEKYSAGMAVAAYRIADAMLRERKR